LTWIEGFYSQGLGAGDARRIFSQAVKQAVSSHLAEVLGKIDH
jgi:hypothetical protein